MIVEHGTVVTLDFELRDAQGELIQEHGGEPIIYLHGSENEVFPKLQEAVEGKAIDPELMRVEDADSFAEDLEIGMQLEEVPVEDENEPDLQADEENTGFGRVWTVTDIAEGKVVLDGNHPFAGMALRYHLKVLDIRAANEEEKAQGAAAQSLFSIAPNPDARKLN